MSSVNLQEVNLPHLQEVSGQARFAGVDEHEAAVEVLDPLLADLEVHGLNVQRQLGLRQAQVDAPLQPPDLVLPAPTCRQQLLQVQHL